MASPPRPPLIHFAKIRTLNFVYSNSGKPYPRPMDHPCKISAPCDHWCGCDLQKFEKLGKIRTSNIQKEHDLT